MRPIGDRPTAIVAHPIWGRGGAEAAAMWIIAALANDFDVTVYTRSGFHLAELNVMAGTTVSAHDITVRLAEVETRWPIGAVAAGRFIRSLPRVGADYDLCVTASGALAWGRRALHFLSAVDWHPALDAQMSADKTMPIRTRVSRAIMAIAAGPKGDLSDDVFIANSDWLKRKSARVCAAEMHVIHPVVPDMPPGRAVADRENRVLMFGRISPEKDIEACIRIVEIARACGFAGRLLIVGPDGHARYSRHIRTLAAARDWIDIRGAMSGSDVKDLLGRVKYGLNACRIEAFGISTGEMAASGMVVLVPADTGQDEIVTDAAQRYITEEEAAARLVALDRDPQLHCRLRDAAVSGQSRFTSDRFVMAVRTVANRTVSSVAVQQQE